MRPRPETASQTAGPYVHIGCVPNAAGVDGVYHADLGQRMITGDAQGARITLSGCIYDGEGAPLCDALVEAWQADAAGRYPHQAGADPHFTGFGRCACDPVGGVFSFDTLRPGPVPWPGGGTQAPHITLWITARGINLALHTRVYFADAPENKIDPVLKQIGEARRQTLIAQRIGLGRYGFDVHLQGPRETVFFDV
ncbi:MAG: protocatechuate 3,4-dioxygenase subunit alpha [Pseudomonadota bacterium]